MTRTDWSFLDENLYRFPIAVLHNDMCHISVLINSSFVPASSVSHAMANVVIASIRLSWKKSPKFSSALTFGIFTPIGKYQSIKSSRPLYMEV